MYKKKNVVGVNIKFPKPYKSNFTINNNFFDNNEDLINKIMQIKLMSKIKNYLIKCIHLKYQNTLFSKKIILAR